METISQTLETVTCNTFMSLYMLIFLLQLNDVYVNELIYFTQFSSLCVIWIYCFFDEIEIKLPYPNIIPKIHRIAEGKKIFQS